MTEGVNGISNVNKSTNVSSAKSDENVKKNFTEEEIKLFDFDGNGQIDSDRELAAYSDYKTAKDEAKLEAKFDINGDGKIDDAERAAFGLYQRLTPNKDGSKYNIDTSIRDLLDIVKREDIKIKDKIIPTEEHPNKANTQKNITSSSDQITKPEKSIYES